MLRTLGSLLIVTLLGLVGCSVGGGGDDDAGTMMMPPEPDAAVPLMSLCTAQLTLTGTFTAAATLDPAGGCQPQGTRAVTSTASYQGTWSNLPRQMSATYPLR